MQQLEEIEILHIEKKRSARVSLMIVFLLNGLVFASWMPQIPIIRKALSLSPGTLGLALLGPPVGFLIGTRLFGWLSSKYGSAIITRLISILYCFCLIGPALAINSWTLFFFLIPLGLTQGGLIVASNANAVMVERHYNRPIMATFHACYSLGGMLGSAIGGFAAENAVHPLSHFIITAGVVSVIVAVATRGLLTDTADSEKNTEPDCDKSQFNSRITKTTILLSLFGFVVLMAEGESANWSAIYFSDITNSSPGIAALGYVVFSSAMAIGRLVGDRLVSRFGALKVVRFSVLMGSLGMISSLLIGTTVSGIIGFALLGGGLSGLIPIIFSAAGNQKNVDSNVALSQVVAISFLGFLIGPPLMGAITQVTNLKIAFVILAVLIGLLFFLVNTIKNNLQSRVET